MINIVDKSLCSGCHACMSVCPQFAITMQEDNEGFLYPIVDENKCIGCDLCDKSCQVLNPITNENEPIVAYACNNLNDAVRMQSSSGGIFSLIAEWIISQNRVVFGAGFDEELNVVHMAVNNINDLSKLRGSKYVQSVIGDSYIQTKELLDAGIKVLFSGTPCQIDGLLHFLRKDYDNLYTLDIICHGVPSPKVWKKYLEYQEILNGSSLSKTKLPTFRSKEDGWIRFRSALFFENGNSYSMTHAKDLYMKVFLKNVSLRPSCYACNSKSVNRNSDITLADLWGCRNIVPDMFDDKGTSFVVINSQKGKYLFDAVNASLIFKEIKFEEAIKFNPAIDKCPVKPRKRQFFFDNIDSMNFSELVEKAVKPTFLKKVQTFFKNYLWAIKNKLKI